MKSLSWLVLICLMCSPVWAQTINPDDDPATIRQKLISRVKDLEQKKPIWQQDLWGTQPPAEARDNYTLLVQIMRDSTITRGEALTALGGTAKAAPNWYHPLLIALMSIVAICAVTLTFRLTGALRTVQVIVLACFVFCGLYPPWNAKLFLGQPLGYAPIFLPPEGLAYVDFVRLGLEWLILAVVLVVVSKWHAQDQLKQQPEKQSEALSAKQTEPLVEKQPETQSES